MGKSSINGPSYTMAMLNNQRVSGYLIRKGDLTTAPEIGMLSFKTHGFSMF